MKAFVRYIDGFSAAKLYQRRIVCCYENYLAYFLCGVLGGNEKFAEIRATGSLSRLAASPLDFASALCSNFQKRRIDFKFTYDRFVRATRSTCVRIFPTASQLSQLTSPSPSLRNSTLQFQHSGETFVRSKHIVLNRS